MRQRPESTAIVVLLMLVAGAGLLGRANARGTSNHNLPPPSPIMAAMPASPTAQVGLAAEAEVGLQFADTPTPPPTLPSALIDQEASAEAVYGPQIPAAEIQPTPIPTPEGYNPPPLEVPLAINPKDHFWMIRPLDSDKTNSAIITYPFGSNGSRDEYRIHHGIDIPNPNGTEIRAAADGTVIWAENGLQTQYEYIGCYANVVVIEHDFGFQGEPVYTLYAHLFAMLVEEGAHVESGQPIGLTGSTGCSTGPHLHFEVRIGENGYNYARNPALWMAPYVGTGVIAGRVTFPSGAPIYDAPITVIDLATGRVVYRTGTYAGPGAESDPVWEETFAIADVPAGQYLVTSYFGSTTWSGEVTVVPGATAWVEMNRYEASERDE